MELFSLAWFGALLSIIGIDLVLAGDNAIVIALAAKSLPPQLRRKAVIYGTAGAIIVRVLAAGVAVYLLRIPGLSAIGGILLLWIAYRLVRDQHQEHDGKESAVSGFWHAMSVIVVADTLMGLDNIIAIAGAARGDVLLVTIGLIISIPIVMGGSFFILAQIKRHPWIVWVGAALLGYTSGNMVHNDVYLAAEVFDDMSWWLHWSIELVPTLALFFLGWRFHITTRPAAQREVESPA